MNCSRFQLTIQLWMSWTVSHISIGLCEKLCACIHLYPLLFESLWKTISYPWKHRGLIVKEWCTTIYGIFIHRPCAKEKLLIPDHTHVQHSEGPAITHPDCSCQSGQGDLGGRFHGVQVCSIALLHLRLTFTWYLFVQSWTMGIHSRGCYKYSGNLGPCAVLPRWTSGLHRSALWQRSFSWHVWFIVSDL